MDHYFKVKELFKNWKSPVIGRKELCELAGGMIDRATLRNLDSFGKGIPGKIRVSVKRVVYPVDQVVIWLEKRISKWNGGNKENGGSNEYN